MPILKNPHHEAFAQGLASGDQSAAEAYRVYVSPKCSAATAETNGPALARKAQVALRIKELKESQAQKAELSRDDLRKWCERVILAKPNEAKEDSDICETIMTKAGPFTAICSKLGAIDRLVKLCGWNEPDKLDAAINVTIKQAWKDAD